jgi:hypothetical protein
VRIIGGGDGIEISYAPNLSRLLCLCNGKQKTILLNIEFFSCLLAAHC